MSRAPSGRVLAQDEAKAWVWVRGKQGFSPGPEVIAGLDEVIALLSLGIELPLSEIYSGIEGR